MAKWTVVYDNSKPNASKVFFDDQPIEGIKSLDITLDGQTSIPMLTLKIFAPGLELENKDNGEE